MRPIVLTRQKGGINRQQVVGSPPNSTLYDLLNGYLYNGERYVARPGSRATHSVPGTKGLAVFRGALVVFSHEVTAVPAGVTCEVLAHPTDSTATLDSIRFVAPFLGYLYVVARFSDGAIFHYWLRGEDAWEANTVYQLGDLVQPTTANGLVYQANRQGDPYPLWAPNVARAVSDTIEPTTPDGYYYVVNQVAGTNPRSGATEPDWNDSEGALTYEGTDTGDGSTGGTGPIDPADDGLPSDVTDRYGGGGVGGRDYQRQ